MEVINILVVSLGCDKNRVDTECMLGLLSKEGYAFTDDETQADVVLVNSCCFINDAKEESIQTILEMARLKETAKLKLLVVAGCLAQRYHEEIREELPEVDILIGTSSYYQICEAIKEGMEGKKNQWLEGEPSYVPDEKTSRILTTPGHYAHLKIAEGCNKNCAYCVIPSIRGKYRSVPMEELVQQAEMLVRQGVKELILVAQETTLYGVDLYQKKSLHLLLQRLNEIPGLVWIRLMYCYPEEIYPELITAIKDNEKVCHYLDMPIQHSENQILKRMNRRTNREELEKTINSIRTQIPDICLRTTLICGFPGETQEEHEELLGFVQKMKFDRLGVFPFSAEEGTPAYTMEPQIDQEVSLEWKDEVMELSEEVISEVNESFIGKTMMALVDGRVAGENTYIARTFRDAPDIDGYLFVNCEEELVTGDVIKVVITGAYEYDLIGELA